jgi:hypothetical protein
VPDRAERQAVNEGLVRDVNERIAGLDRNAAANWAEEDQLFEFRCECSTPACEEQVRMTLEEYDEVRHQDDRFVVVPGHETAAIERVVSSTDRFTIVDKVDAVEPYVADDPRGAASN